MKKIKKFFKYLFHSVLAVAIIIILAVEILYIQDGMSIEYGEGMGLLTGFFLLVFAIFGAVITQET